MPYTVKRILLPTDFSANAEHAHAYALEIAKKLNATITLLHVFEEPLLSLDELVVKKDEHTPLIMRDMRKTATDALVALAGEAKSETGVPHNMMTCEGEIIEQILKISEDEEIDLIIMGTLGKMADINSYMGSTTKKLLTDAICPIIAIPLKANVQKLFKNIVYTTELAYDESHAVHYLNDLAEMFDAQVTMLHVATAEESYEENEHLTNLLQLVDHPHFSHVSYASLCNKNVDEGINEFVKTNKADMLAITTSKLYFMEDIFHKSLSKKMLLHSEIPFLSVNRKKHYTRYFT